ncbi:3-deoxy-manno-octulosonate cytidylyltransferase [Alistipes sp. OttesenSCG-928-L06]|nr:3-deoxy-manno-octulosonate cytidylyltransferase [Alistipes sp. OttesenSCG-928-L06]
MRTLALIPARYASSRFPGKPLADIAGKPMIQRVYERASAVYDACYVATDDERIEAAVRAFGGKAVMTSPDHQSGTDRCREALDAVEAQTGRKFDIVINVQGDEPFVDKDQLRQLSTLFTDARTHIATLVKPFSAEEDIFNPNSPKVVMTGDGYALYFSRSVIPYLRSVKDQKAWQESHLYFKHLGIYAYRSEVLREVTELRQSPLELAESLEQLRWLENGYRIKVAITDIPNYAIDTPEDLEQVVRLYREGVLK